MYADLRNDFEDGLNSIMDAIARVSNPNQGRLKQDDGFSDWAIDWEIENGLFNMRFTIIEFSKNINLTFLTEIHVICNDILTKRQNQFIEAGLDWIGRMIISEALFDYGDQNELRIVLNDQFPKVLNAKMTDSKRGTEYTIVTSCRRLGEDNGKVQTVNMSHSLLFQQLPPHSLLYISYSIH